MTRTILNWSELLDQYQSKCGEDSKRLKKWSDMGEPERKKPIPEINESGLEKRSTHEYIAEHDSKPAQFNEINISERPEAIEFKDETDGNPFLELDGQEIIQDNIETNNDEIPKISQPKATILELFYDCIMQDTETIPAMYAKYCDENNKDFS